MALLIDGYNLLHVTSIFAGAGPGTELHRARLALLEFLAASLSERERRETTIVFDAAGAPPGLPRTLAHDAMTVHFARRHADADAMIEELLEQCAAPRALLVVSSDHRVQRAARRRGASFVDSERWYRNLLAARGGNEAAADDVPAKPMDQIASNDVEYWVGQFADGRPDDTAAGPFPPGYADDLLEEE
jgi:predicted RNA-binding protein with PIN domain